MQTSPVVGLNAQNADVPAATPFRYPRRVAFAETDLTGGLHFANLLRYFEEAEQANVQGSINFFPFTSVLPPLKTFFISSVAKASEFAKILRG